MSSRRPREDRSTTKPAARRVKAGIAAATAVLVVGAVVSNAYASQGNPVKTHPVPALFTAAQVATVADDLSRQKGVADALFRTWSAAHPAQDDAAFTTFALSQLPPPPDAAAQGRELAELRALAAARTPAGQSAASWLEVYGKKDVWKLYLGDATETDAGPVRKKAKAVFAADTTLAKVITATAQARFGRQAPTVLDPSLRQGAPRKDKLSYPSKHAVYVYSELAVLTALDPGRAPDFQHMADEVAFSRLYAAGHYRSDLVQGALLGDLVGDYEARLLAVAPAARPAGAA